MNKQQILESIEQPSKDYAKSLWECGMYDKDTPATPEDMAIAFKAGAKWMAEQFLPKEDKTPTGRWQ